jgi:penicillin amidase
LALKRVLKYFNIAVALLLAAALGLLYWYAYRPLPQTSGTLTAPVSQKATVTRDALGVPHITAASIEDALFLQGFVTAQDRLWQMDALRRLAAGRLAEIVGPQGLDSDREARRFRLERLAEDHARSLSPQDRAALAAYARGVNFFIRTHRHRLPLEFTLLHYDPRPWRVADSILLGLQMFRTLTKTWRREIQKSAMLAEGDPTKVNFLFPVRMDAETQPGSNSWVLAGSRTASGRPLLANDPHLEYSIPSIWFMVHLRAPALEVAGVSIPGVPSVILGHNDRIAWGMTNLGFDVQDLYIEKLDPRTGRYLYRGQLEQARLERELISVKGAPPLEFSVWVTRHGPILAEHRNQFLALRWVAAESSGFEWPFVDLNRAHNWQEFTAALSHFPGPAQNFLYADSDGNIGYHAAGKLPIRKTYDGDVPIDGSSGNYEWQGYIPFDQLPQAYNPPSGLLVTANQNPFPPNFPYRVNGNFAAPYRARQVEALLSTRKNWRPEQMLALQTDVYSAFSHFLARQIVAAYDRRGVANPALADAIAILRSWNGQMDKDQSAPFIATLAFQHLRQAVAERASPGSGAAYDLQAAPAVLEQLLRSRPTDWFPDYDQLLLRSFVDALEEGRRIQGRDVKKWNYGAYNQLLIPHPIGHHLPLVAKYFDIGPVPMSGSGITVAQITPELGPSMRMTIDLSNFDNSRQNIVTGQSGHLLSSHYKDQWDAYYTGRSFPMPFRNLQPEHTLLIEPEKP